VFHRHHLADDRRELDLHLRRTRPADPRGEPFRAAIDAGAGGLPLRCKSRLARNVTNAGTTRYIHDANDRIIASHLARNLPLDWKEQRRWIATQG